MNSCFWQALFPFLNSFFFSPMVSVALLLILSLRIAGVESEIDRNIPCDLFQGSWVRNASQYAPYTYSSCPFIQPEFNCLENGRPDEFYLQYQWQPHACNLIRMDGGELFRRFRGKRIMFVGDSLSRNQFQSFLCILYSSVPAAKAVKITAVGQITTISFLNFGVQVMLDHTEYLVDIVTEAKGRILKLDSIEGGKLWLGIDVLIFNTWHWWYRRGIKQPWDYIEVGGQIYKDMDRMIAFEKALFTWARWVDNNVNTAKTKVLFQGISPSHYNGSLWNEPRARSCIGERVPVEGSTYPGGIPPALFVLKKVLRTIKKPVQLLDITNLSLLRKDGHPSIYGLPGIDCSHWCLPGLPDTWNQILYNLIL